tara:strand:- start:164 stop:352 length:189 start_codon:yes stop_codon:yes gene_type:complete
MNKEESYKKFYEMLFIFNAIQNGWSVQKINRVEYKFSNKNKSIIKNFNIQNFINKNLINPFI